MIYKFVTEKGDRVLEVTKVDDLVKIEVHHLLADEFQRIELNQSQLFDLIGALHSLKTKISK